MKNLLVLLLASIILFSCEKDELIYSCDQEIDAIVKSGIIGFSEITLLELLEYDIILQKAIYRSLAPVKKKALWIEKLNRIEFLLKMSPKEIKHFDDFKDWITSNNFDFNSQNKKLTDKSLEFEMNWRQYAQDSLSWDLAKIGFVVSSLEIVEYDYRQKIVQQMEITLESLNGVCVCSTESDYCGQIGGSCTSGGCSVTAGCGWLWSSNCDGSCF